MSDLALLILLFVAVGVGFALGSARRRRASADLINREYFLGLNHLLNERPDEAIETFTRALDVSGETIDTHLALGTLLRRRGEVEKATAIHERLLERTDLTREQKLLVQYEMARDYLSAGILGRSEDLLRPLTAFEHEYRDASRASLMEIYEREAEWEKAAELAADATSDPVAARSLSHYHCELGLELLGDGFASATAETGATDPGDRTASARGHFEQALTHDPLNPRASLLLAAVDVREGRFAEARRALHRLADQDVAFVSEALPGLREIAAATDGQDDLALFLERCYRAAPSVPVLLELVRLQRSTIGEQAAFDYLEQAVRDWPTLAGLKAVAESRAGSPGARVALKPMLSAFEALLRDRPLYQCVNCGFSGRTLHWNCPMCKEWGTTKPLTGAERSV